MNRPRQPPHRIAIVGCGVAGLTAAMLLAQQGHEVTLLEQSPAVGPVGAGVLLQPSGQLVLDALGLLAEVTARSAPIVRLYARTHRSRTLIDLPYGRVEHGMHAFGLHRGDLFAVLHRHVCQSGVTIQLNSRIVRFVETDTGIELFAADGQPHGKFDLLIAADGSRSALREASGLRASVYRYPHSALWALGKSVADASGSETRNSSVVTDHLLQATRGTRELCGLLPMGDSRCSLFWSVDHQEKQPLLDAGVVAWKRQVIGLMPEAAEMLEPLNSFEQVRFTDYYHVNMPRWHSARCVFVGDAAHAMSPHLGQGINLALLDGLSLAHAMCITSTIGDALTTYENLLRTHTNYYAFITRLLSPFFQSRGVIKGLLRDLFLPHMHRLPWIGSQMLLTMTGLKRSALGGKLTLPQQLR